MKTNRYLLFILLFFIGFHSRASSQISQYTLLTTEPRQYEKMEWDITLICTWENPYLYPNIAVDMLFETPSGKSISLPCYYIAGASGEPSHWRARFTPQEAGCYGYHIILSKANEQTHVSDTSTFSVSSTFKRGFIHRNDDWTFRFDNGERFRGIGENIGWESRSNDDSKFFKALHENPRFNYYDMLGKLASYGGNFFRTWMCSWNLPLEWKQVINTSRYRNTTDHFNPDAINRMDQLVELTDSLGVYFMLTLDHAGSYIGAEWEINSYNLKNGGPAASPEDFFRNPRAIVQYKSRLRYLVARWGYSPSIAAWEFFNEIDNVMYAGDADHPIKDEIIVAWHDEMSRYLKSIDPYGHMITTSISHREVQGLNSIESIDFNQKHIYKKTDAIPSALRQYSSRFDKPYVIGEFAYDWDWSKDFNLTAAEFDQDFKRGLWYGLFSPTPILPMTWWWEFFDHRGTTSYIARVKEIYIHMMNAGRGSFESVAITADEKNVQAYGVRCGEKTFIYLVNQTDRTVETSVTLPMLKPGRYRAQTYDTESGLYRILGEYRVIGNSLQLAGLSLTAAADVVIVIGR